MPTSSQCIQAFAGCPAHYAADAAWRGKSTFGIRTLTPRLCMRTAAKQAFTLLQLRCWACGCTHTSSSPAWPGGLLSSRNANCSSAHKGTCEEEQVWVSACTIQAGGVAGGAAGFCGLGPPHGSMLGCIASSLYSNQSINQSINQSNPLINPSISPSNPINSFRKSSACSTAQSQSA